MNLKAVCQTCNADLVEHGKPSRVGNFLFCSLCKAVYTVSQVREVMHPEYGPMITGHIQLLRPGNLNNIPKPKLSDEDVKDMLGIIKESFGPIQFKDILQERGNITEKKKD